MENTAAAFGSRREPMPVITRQQPLPGCTASSGTWLRRQLNHNTVLPRSLCRTRGHGQWTGAPPLLQFNADRRGGPWCTRRRAFRPLLRPLLFNPTGRLLWRGTRLTIPDRAAVSGRSGRLGRYQRTKVKAERAKGISRNEPNFLVSSPYSTVIGLCRFKCAITAQVGPSYKIVLRSNSINKQWIL